MAVQLYGCSQSFIDFYLYGYRLLDKAPHARMRYSVGEDEPLILQHYLLLRRARPGAEAPEIARRPEFRVVVELPDGSKERMGVARFGELPPPLAQSFYILEQSTWSGYAALWRERGKHDFFWLWAAGVLPRE